MSRTSRVHPAPFSALPKRLQKFVKRLPSGCWTWQGYHDRDGEPITSYHATNRMAHRVVYEILTNVPLASNEPLTQTCGLKRCLNPLHQAVGAIRNSTPSTTAQFGQAAHICSLFGGERRMSQLLGVNESTCYRWSYPPPKGTDGIIPSRHVNKIKSIARFHGVLLSEEDWAPRPNPKFKEK